MRYFKIEYGTPYCGTDEIEYLKFPKIALGKLHNKKGLVF